MDINESDLPFKVEYARSGRATCRGCATTIGKGFLRFAVMVQSMFFDGKQPNWFHENCFFKKRRPLSEGDIANFGNIKLEDQKSIREKILLSETHRGQKRTSTNNCALKSFGIEYAKSSRWTCQACEQIIIRGNIRVKKSMTNTDLTKNINEETLWYHFECFAQCRSILNFVESGEFLPGFNNISKEDQEMVKEKLPKKVENTIQDIKKPKLEVLVCEFEKKLEKQQTIYFNYYEIATKVLKKNECLDLLIYNDQQPARNDTGKLFNQVADMLAFGALEPCPICSGQLRFNKTGYLCSGNLTEWTKCATFIKEPEKVKCKIPDHIVEKYKLFQKYEGEAKVRLVKYVVPSATVMKQIKNIEDLSTDNEMIVQRPPLYNFKVATIGIKSEDEKIKNLVQNLGGTITKSVNENTTIIISNEKEVEKMGKKMCTAKKFGIHVVPQEYLNFVETDNSCAISFILSKTLCDWGIDPSARLAQKVQLKSGNKLKSIYTKSMPKSLKLKLNGGSAVDPDSGLEDEAQIYRKGNAIYNAVLGLTDIQKNKNSYYKLQVLESNKGNKFWVFRSWGRIATTIGGTKLESFGNVLDAIKSFEFHYRDKSGNNFEDRDSFQKLPGRLCPIDVDYCEENIDKLDIEKPLKSKLSTQVQDLIKLIFDVDVMKKTILEFDLDMDKMPLGKLSAKQIQNAYKVLSELSNLINIGGTKAQFIDGTNRFYTLIPHNFGVDNPPILDTVDKIKHHNDTLDNLLEIEFAYSLIKNRDKGGQIHAIDKHYQQLNTELQPLEESSEEFRTLCKYVKNTHAETHCMYELKVMEIFKVVRKNELLRYEPFKVLHNRKLLWHGSRLTNFAGILSCGLKIAPPEAPSTGYMFGKGIYFADMVSKSANYCCTNKENAIGLMLLSEVALGNMYELTQADYITKLPKNKHSCKGVGRTQPDPKKSLFRIDGVEIPLGESITNDSGKFSLLYNEFIVYDVAQVNIQYLLKMNFNYKY